MLTTSTPGFVASRYFQRLEEAMAARFPKVLTPDFETGATLDDFYLAIRKLTRDYKLPGLGFDFGCRIRISDYGVVGLATASARNLSEAIEVQLRFLKIISNTSKLAYRLSRSEKWITLELREVDLGRRLDPFTIESELGAQIRFVTDLLPSANMSRCILSLPHACPTTGEYYKSRGGCQVKFNQPGARLQLPASWADSALESRDEMLSPMLAERCQMILAQMNQGDDWVQRVRSYLLTSDSVKKSLNETADALGVSTSGLRWHLAKNDANYKQILLDIRMKLACQYLDETPLTLQQIGYQLGYNYSSNFQLAFKSFFGTSPGKWRRSNG